MSTRSFSRYSLSFLFFFSLSFLGRAQQEPRAWIFGAKEDKPELLNLKVKKENINFIELRTFDNIKKQKQVTHLLERMEKHDEFIFFLSSSTLVHYPLDILNYLRQMLDFIPNEKFFRIVSQLRFLIKEDSYESIDNERAKYYLFRLQNKLEKIYNLKAYDEKEIHFKIPEKDSKILDPLEKSIRANNISVLK